MKVAEYSGSGTVASGDLRPVDIGISNNPEDQRMILNVLTNTLYTDKVSAVWREYGCNAFDANVEAGRGDQPIVICLPTPMEPNAIIRDKGYGMTEEQVLNTFCQLGCSTKRTSNAFTGMLGIGSKAGFAYGDAFMVTSYANGVKTIYNCFRDQGAPRMARMHAQPCDKSEQGIEIKVPVRKQDIAEFVSKAAIVFKHFKVLPEVHGGTIDFKRGDVSFSGTGWRYRGDNQGSVAIMGNVNYRIDQSALTGLSNKHVSLLALGLELDFEIGELEIAANREGLQYKDLTRDSIRLSLELLMKELGVTFTQKIAGATCLWEAKMLYGTAFERIGNQYSYGHHTLKDVLDAKILWRGAPVTTARFDIETDGDDVRVARFWHYHSSRLRRDLQERECYASDKTLLVINDLPSRKLSPSRIREYFATNRSKTDSMVIFTFDTDAAQKRYWKLKQLEGAPTILFSSLPKAPTIIGSGSGPSAHSAKHSARAFELDTTYDGGGTYSKPPKSSWWKNIKVDFKNDAGVYVVVDGFCARTPVAVAAYQVPEDLSKQVQDMASVGLLKTECVGIKRAEEHKLGSGWVKLEDHLRKTVDDLIVKEQAQQLIADYMHAESYVDLFDTKHINKLPLYCVARELLGEVVRMRTPKLPIKMLKYIHHGKGKPWMQDLTLLPPTVDLGKLEEKVHAKYPLLLAVPRNKCRTTDAKEFNAIADYITLVEGL